MARSIEGINGTMKKLTPIFIILLVAGVVLADTLDDVIKTHPVTSTNSTSAFAAQDTTRYWRATSDDGMKVYRCQSIYLMYIDSSTGSETVYVCQDYKPTGADSLGWFAWDSFGFVTPVTANVVCTTFVHDTLTIWPSDSIRLRLHRLQTTDSLREYRIVSRFYNLR